MVKVLKSRDVPVSAGELQRLLANMGLSPNKTTIYRELTILKEREQIRELQFGDVAMRYELMPDDHHHHVICKRCDKVRDISELSLKIPKLRNFTILHHSLEFYGLCKNCA